MVTILCGKCKRHIEAELADIDNSTSHTLDLKRDTVRITVYNPLEDKTFNLINFVENDAVIKPGVTRDRIVVLCAACYSKKLDELMTPSETNWRGSRLTSWSKQTKLIEE